MAKFENHCPKQIMLQSLEIPPYSLEMGRKGLLWGPDKDQKRNPMSTRLSTHHLGSCLPVLALNTADLKRR